MGQLGRVAHPLEIGVHRLVMGLVYAVRWFSLKVLRFSPIGIEEGNIWVCAELGFC